MIAKSQPLVSVVTPVYNGGEYLAECIESVLAQTYQNWEYIIANNCSKDSTLEIAKSYAAKDSRISVHNNKDFLGPIQNWNNALRQISTESKYCKVVHADDLLFPECIERMVDIAEGNTKIGIVSSYILANNKVICNYIPYPATVFSGREICRSTLRGDYAVFGPPSALLIRSSLIREYKPFYNESKLHADTEVCFRILQDYDFAFVHQVLSFVRRHEESLTETVSSKYNTLDLENIGMLIEYGQKNLEKDDYKLLLRKSIRNYYRFLGRNLLLFKNKEFWDYHKKGLKDMGYSLSVRRLAVGLFWEISMALFNLQGTVVRIGRKVNANKKKL